MAIRMSRDSLAVHPTPHITAAHIRSTHADGYNSTGSQTAHENCRHAGPTNLHAGSCHTYPATTTYCYSFPLSQQSSANSSLAGNGDQPCRGSAAQWSLGWRFSRLGDRAADARRRLEHPD